MKVRGELLVHPRHEFLYAQVVGPQGKVLKEKRLARRGHSREELEAAGWDLARQLLDQYCREHREAQAVKSQGDLFGP